MNSIRIASHQPTLGGTAGRPEPILTDWMFQIEFSSQDPQDRRASFEERRQII
jgi:hypothetical protein